MGATGIREAAMTDGTETAAESEPPPEDSTDEVDVFAGDDPKAKFREALARKHGGGGKGAEGAEGNSKVSSTHGPAKAQRTFRRKSGG
jgi:hypothetical protein